MYIYIFICPQTNIFIYIYMSIFMSLYLCLAGLLSDFTQDLYVAIQFYLGFKFYFPLF